MALKLFRELGGKMFRARYGEVIDAPYIRETFPRVHATECEVHEKSDEVLTKHSLRNESLELPEKSCLVVHPSPTAKGSGHGDGLVFESRPSPWLALAASPKSQPKITHKIAETPSER